MLTENDCSKAAHNPLLRDAAFENAQSGVRTASPNIALGSVATARKLLTTRLRDCLSYVSNTTDIRTRHKSLCSKRLTNRATLINSGLNINTRKHTHIRAPACARASVCLCAFLRVYVVFLCTDNASTDTYVKRPN